MRGFNPAQYESPGQNTRLGDVLLRAFTLKAPPMTRTLPYAAGSDVPVTAGSQ